ncbi:MAG TPA: YkgJ family cysteine cluster protein, partial [Candidatus Cybelea sp.]|nr:YkgJ family cysteine cluster protein [Candidatus Cybelea sp.]
MTRACSGCTLCCKLLPMKKDKQLEARETMNRMIEVGMMTREQFAQMTPDFDKPAGKRCPHQRHSKGCAIYARRPFGC